MLFIWCVLMTLYQPLKLLFWLATSLQYFTPYGCLWVHAYTSINCDQLSTTYSLCWKPLIRVTDTNNKGKKLEYIELFCDLEQWPWHLTLSFVYWRRTCISKVNFQCRGFQKTSSNKTQTNTCNQAHCQNEHVVDVLRASWNTTTTV